MSSPNFLNVEPAYCFSSGSSEYVAVSVWMDGSSMSDESYLSRTMVRQFETALSVSSAGCCLALELDSLTDVFLTHRPQSR